MYLDLTILNVHHHHRTCKTRLHEPSHAQNMHFPKKNHARVYTPLIWVDTNWVAFQRIWLCLKWVNKTINGSIQPANGLTHFWLGLLILKGAFKDFPLPWIYRYNLRMCRLIFGWVTQSERFFQGFSTTLNVSIHLSNRVNTMNERMGRLS